MLESRMDQDCFRLWISELFLPPDLWVIGLFRLLYLLRCGCMFSKGPLRFRDGGFCGPAFREALGLMSASDEHGEAMVVEEEEEKEGGKG